MKKKPIKTSRCAIYATKRDRDIYGEYVEGILLPNEKKAFEKHMNNCPICSKNVVDAWLVDKMVRKSPILSKTGKKRSLNRKLAYLNQMRDPQKNDTVFLEDTEPLALAASPPRRLDCHGVAYGVAVDREKRQGLLLECIAVVSEVPKLRSKLEIRAIECKTSQSGEKITTPSDHLEDILDALFITHEVLLPFRLWEKAICVEINCKMGSGYIVEPDSMGLAVLVAILSAVTGKKINKDILFSAGIKLKGYLEGVGALEDKIQVAKVHRMKTCFTADETRPISADKTIKKSGIALHYFNKLDEVLTKLGLIEKKSVKKSGSGKKGNATRTKKK